MRRSTTRPDSVQIFLTRREKRALEAEAARRNLPISRYLREKNARLLEQLLVRHAAVLPPE